MREDGGGAWDPKFMGSFNDWEMKAVQEFIRVTSNIKISPLEKDKLSWKGDESGSFKVKAYFKELEGASPHKVPCKMLWNQRIPSKVGFFAWEVWWGKVLTSTQLTKQGFHIASMCPFCRKEEEELEHILIHCHAIWGQWTDLLLAFGVDWTCPFLAKDLIQSWIHFLVRKKTKAIWRAPTFILGYLEREEQNCF